MHFNAAMLELHSRLHHLDMQREQRQQRRRLQESTRVTPGASPAAANSTSAAAAVRGSSEVQGHAAAGHAEHEEADRVGEDVSGESEGFEDDGGDAASDRQVSAWFDDAQWQQKEAKAAVLAIRKHLRCVGCLGVRGMEKTQILQSTHHSTLWHDTA